MTVMTSRQRRTPAGQPTGGQFAASARAEAEQPLTDSVAAMRTRLTEAAREIHPKAASIAVEFYDPGVDEDYDEVGLDVAPAYIRDASGETLVDLVDDHDSYEKLRQITVAIEDETGLIDEDHIIALDPRPLSPAEEAFQKDLERFNTYFQDVGALIWEDWKIVGIDPTIVPGSISDTYSRLLQYGYANGLI